MQWTVLGPQPAIANRMLARTGRIEGDTKSRNKTEMRIEFRKTKRSCTFGVRGKRIFVNRRTAGAHGRRWRRRRHGRSSASSSSSSSSVRWRRILHCKTERSWWKQASSVVHGIRTDRNVFFSVPIYFFVLLLVSLHKIWEFCEWLALSVSLGRLTTAETAAMGVQERFCLSVSGWARCTDLRIL